MKLGAVLLGLFLTAGMARGLPAKDLAEVSVDVKKLGELIPRDFEGFSIQFDPSPENTFRGEASSPAYVLGGASAPNRVFYQLLRNLGAGTLRTNSGYASEPCWNSSAAPHPEACPAPITEDLVNGYAKASAATGWGIVVEINLAQNSASWALQFGKEFAAAVRETPGSKLLGFEFGNEPDLYASEMLFGRTPIRPPDYSWRDLVKDWEPYIAAFKANPLTAPVPLVGPAYDSGGWTTPSLGSFIDGVGAKNLGFVTVHDYPPDVCGGKTVRMADLLSEVREEAYVREAREWVRAAQARGLPLVLGETNSVACEGEKGVSDVFASTVWGLDWLFTNFQVGMRSLYFHLNNSYYSPVFVTTYRSPDDGELRYADFVAPLYYAMYTFSTQAENKHLLAARVQTGANIKAYAVRETSTGPVTVFVVNKDLRAAGTVLITPSAPMGTGQLQMVQAPSLDSRAVSYGRVGFDNATGLLAGEPNTTTVTAGPSGSYQISLPNASIAILTMAP